MSRRTHWLALAMALLCTLAVPGAARAFTGPLCPGVTCGGTRTPTLSFDGGPGLQHAVVVPIFVGPFWSTDPDLQAQMIGMMQGTLNGPYVAALNQYGTTLNGPNRISTARMAPAAPIVNNPYCNPPSSPSCEITEGIAQTIIVDAIADGVVPPPVSGVDTLYTLVLANDGTPVSPPSSFNFPGWYEGTPFRGMWIRSWGTGSAAPSLGFTHELAESLTNHVGTNCVDSYGNENQIADLCECYITDSYTLGKPNAAYWSENDGLCVVPEGWTDLYQYTGTPGSWIQIYSGALHQAYAGLAGLIMTDLSDNPYLYSGAPGDWSQIGGPGSMFAVGTNDILGMAPDASYVAKYYGPSEGWYVINSGYSSAVYAGVVDLYTDLPGNSYQYQGSGTSWSQIGTWANQYLVGNSWVAALNWNRSVIWLRGPNDSGWSEAGSGGGSELFVGGWDMLMRRQLNGSGNLDVLNANDTWGTPWNLGAEDMAALWGWGSSDYANAAVMANNYVIYTDTGVDIAPYGGTRLVGGGANLYTTYGFTY